MTKYVRENYRLISLLALIGVFMVALITSETVAKRALGERSPAKFASQTKKRGYRQNGSRIVVVQGGFSNTRISNDKSFQKEMIVCGYSLGFLGCWV